MTRILVLALVAWAGCAKHADEPAGEAPAVEVERIPMPEVTRGEDACKAYAAHACTCAKTVPAAAKPCELAPALVDAANMALGIAQSSQSEHLDALHGKDSFRKTVAECIEQIISGTIEIFWNHQQP